MTSDSDVHGEVPTLTAASLPALGAAGRAELRAAIDGVPREELAGLLDTPEGGLVLRQAFERMPDYFRGGPPPSAGWSLAGPATVRWQLRRESAEPITYDLTIDGTRCWVEPAGDVTDPGATLTLEAVSFVELISGLREGMDLLMRGHLHIEGDAQLALQVESLFGLADVEGRP